MNKGAFFLSAALLLVLALLGIRPLSANESAIPPTPLPVWRTETAAAGVALATQGVPGMALDAQGRPHVVYGLGHLLHAWLDGATWRVEVVDAAAGSTAGPVIAVDDSGVVTIVACTVRFGQGTPPLTVYRRAPGEAWQKTIVAAPGLAVTSDTYLSLALDSAGQPHVMAANKALVYAHLTPQGWLSERVPLAVEAGGPIALAFDNHDRPAVLYEGGVGEYSREILWLGRQGAAGWAHEQVALADFIAGKSLAFDAGGRAHAVFSGHYPPMVSYLHQTATGWQSVDVGRGRAPSLALDDTGRPHIIYTSDPDFLLYTVLEDGGWQESAALYDPQHIGSSNTLLLDHSGFAHVISLNEADRLQYVTNRSGTWAAQRVAVHDPVGGRSAMALDPADTPYLLYYRPATQQLRWATRSGDAWTTGPVADVAADGLELALAIGPDGVPQAAYTDSAADALVAGRLVGGQWTLETVATAGRSLALAVGSDNRPQLIQIEDGQVVYHTKTGDHWIAEPVSIAGEAVESAFLALDSANRPVVVYAGTMAVRQGPGAWRRDSGPSADILAMALGPDDSVYLLITREEQMPSGAPPPIYWFYVSLLERQDDGWKITDLADGIMPLEKRTARLMVDARGRVVVAYFSFYGVARCQQRDEDGQWSVNLLGALEGDLGLAIGRDHRPRVSGSDQGDLLFLTQEIIWLDHHVLLPVTPRIYY